MGLSESVRRIGVEPYDQTRQELTLLANKVKRSGVILGDDWFSELSHPFHGQHVAINEFVNKGAYQIVYANDTDHQWAISAIRDQK